MSQIPIKSQNRCSTSTMMHNLTEKSQLMLSWESISPVLLETDLYANTKSMSVS